MENKDLFRLLLSVGACVAIGLLTGYIASTYISGWYYSIEKPFFSPPNWLSAPIWTILYIMMGYAFGLIWNSESEDKKGIKKAMILFGIQLLLNILWPVLFFVLHNPLLSFIEIILLWFVIIKTIQSFKKIDDFAAKILYPYIGWISFAVVFNGCIWWLNK